MSEHVRVALFWVRVVAVAWIVFGVLAAPEGVCSPPTPADKLGALVYLAIFADMGYELAKRRTP